MKKVIALSLYISMWVFSGSAMAMWGTMPEMYYARTDPMVAVDDQDIVYIIGGEYIGVSSDTFLATVERFTPSWGWQLMATMPFAVSQGDAVYYQDMIYIPGGLAGDTVIAPNLLVYDPAENEWQVQTAIPEGRRGYTFDLVGNIMICAGGADFDTTLETVWAYDPVGRYWTELAPMNTPRTFHGSAVLDGRLYVFGGISGTTVMPEYLAGGEMYDPLTDTWTPIAEMPVTFYAGSSGAMEARAWACHGVQNNGVSAACHQYDPASDAWASGFNANIARDHVGSFGSPIYAAGGLRHDFEGVSSLSVVEGWGFFSYDDDDDDDDSWQDDDDYYSPDDDCDYGCDDDDNYDDEYDDYYDDEESDRSPCCGCNIFVEEKGGDDDDDTTDDDDTSDDDDDDDQDDDDDDNEDDDDDNNDNDDNDNDDDGGCCGW